MIVGVVAACTGLDFAAVCAGVTWTTGCGEGCVGDGEKLGDDDGGDDSSDPTSSDLFEIVT